VSFGALTGAIFAVHQHLSIVLAALCRALREKFVRLFIVMCGRAGLQILESRSLVQDVDLYALICVGFLGDLIIPACLSAIVVKS